MQLKLTEESAVYNCLRLKNHFLEADMQSLCYYRQCF